MAVSTLNGTSHIFPITPYGGIVMYMYVHLFVSNAIHMYRQLFLMAWAYEDVIYNLLHIITIKTFGAYTVFPLPFCSPECEAGYASTV